MKKVLVIVGGSVLVLLVLWAGFWGYMGMFGSIQVLEQDMGPFTFVYESYVGPYQETGKVFDKVYKALQADGIATTKGLGIYHDDPRQVSREKLRSDCGVVVEEADLAKLDSLKVKYQIQILEKKASLVAPFPIRNSLSYMFGPMKGYAALTRAAREKKYTMGAPYEYYDEKARMIYFVAPIEK